MTKTKSTIPITKFINKQNTTKNENVLFPSNSKYLSYSLGGIKLTTVIIWHYTKLFISYNKM